MKGVEPEDTGLSDPLTCIEVPVDGKVQPGLGWGSTSICTFHPDPLEPCFPGNAQVQSFQIKGTEASQDPGSYPVRLVTWTQESYPDDSNLVSDDLTAVGSTGDWIAAAGTGDLGSINSCHPLCEWGSLFVEIQDTTRAAPNPTDCDDYLPKMEVCFEWIYTNARRRAPQDTECVAGSGRFQLVPYRLVNRDSDANVSAILRAVQTSGTGVMTGAAWINEIELVEDQGETLRVAKVNQDYGFSTSDMLLNPSAVSVALLQTTTTFNNGVLTGGTPFILEEVPETTEANLIVDMEWSCGSLGMYEELVPPKGYTFSLAQLDCLGDWPQQMTIRPVPHSNPKTLHLEMYGMLEDRVFLPLTQVSNTWTFSYARRGLEVEGSLLSFNGSSAQVDLDTIEFDDVSICDPDVYTFGAEE